MRHNIFLVCSALSLAACGFNAESPAGTDTDTHIDTDADPSGTGEPGGSGALQPTTDEVVLEVFAPTTDGDSTTGTTTTDTTPGEPTSTTTTTDTAPDATPVCPEGHVRWEKIGGATIVVPPGASEPRAMAPMADGHVAMAVVVTEDDRAASGLLTVTPTGEVLGLQVGELGPPEELVHVEALARAYDGRLIVSEERILGQDRVQRISSFAADAAPLAALSLPDLPYRPFTLHGDDAVVAGRDKGQLLWWATRVALDDGAQAWQTELVGSDGDVAVQALVTAPAGDLLLVGSSNQVVDGVTRMHAWRLDPAGLTQWVRTVEVPTFDAVYDVGLGPDDRLFVMRFGPWPQGQVELTALDFATGAPLWEVTVATADPAQRFVGVDSLIIDDVGLTIPLIRSEPGSLMLSGAAVQQVSFAGELQELVPLEVPTGGEFALRTARGTCGELLIWTGVEHNWLGAFAPCGLPLGTCDWVEPEALRADRAPARSARAASRPASRP